MFGDGSAPARLMLLGEQPSAVLRADDRDAVYAGLVNDVRAAADILRAIG